MGATRATEERLEAMKAMETVVEGVSVWQSIVLDNIDYISRVPSALLTLVVGYFILRGLKAILGKALKLAKVDATLRSMIQSTVTFTGWVLVVAAALSAMQLHQLSLALGGSIALVAMALATGLNSVAQDLLAGIFLLSDEKFVVGTRVLAGGVEGVVEELTIRKTRIRDASGKLHTIPNRNVDSATYIIFDREAAEEKAG